MLRLEKLRQLALRTAPAPGRPRHLSAASGLVRVEDRLYVIADDEHQLGVFSAEGSEPGTLLTVLPGGCRGIIHLLLVTGPDDPALPAAVLAGTL